MLYARPHPDGNSFACETCHALTEPAADGVRRAGHALGDAARRPTFKNGAFTDLLDAVNACRVDWMAAPAFEADDPRWARLRDFLAAQAPAGEARPVSFAVVEPPSDLAGGDAVAGRALFDASCSICHGAGAAGTERGPSLDGDLLTDDLVARRVRTSGPAGGTAYEGLTGGRMPFFSAERLSDDELRDLVAFVRGNEPAAAPPPASPPAGDAPRPCPSTHPKVGQVAELSRAAHGVGGRARIVDDCTIEVNDFTYDGGGINVRFYGGVGGDYDAGFSMSEADLRRRTPYAGETVYARLPPGRTLDDLDGISVWCVAVGFSFGDGLFGP
jgi:mono/diheme cytochrome c family protein